MGMKKRTRRFTGPLQVAVVRALRSEGALSKDDLLTRMRVTPDVQVSVTKLQLALEKLIDGGWVEKQGARAGARFHALS
jgi:hypothetical protein